MKSLFVSLCLWLCFTAPAQAMEESEMLGYLKNIAFPLYDTDESPEIKCLGFNATKNASGQFSYFVSAAHCRDARFIRSANGHPLFKEFPVQSRTRIGVYDEQLLLKPECGGAYPAGFSTGVTPGEKYFMLGHESPSDTFDQLKLLRLVFVRKDPKWGLVFRHECVGAECRINWEPGVSGSPIVGADGVVVGVYKGLRASQPEQILASPVDVLMKLLDAAKQDPTRLVTARYCGRETK